jgi:hypothetical protein
MIVLIACVMVVVATPAFAQPIEVAPLVSYSTGAELEQTADGVDGLDIDDGLAFGVRGTYFLTERLGLEGLWTYQSTALSMTASSVTAEVFEFSLHQVYGNVSYQFGPTGTPWQPFVFGGAGASLFRADDLEGETKPAWNVGGGLKWLFSTRFGVEGRVRYKPTELSESADDYCDPFDFCQSRLNQFEISVGAVVRCCK